MVLNALIKEETKATSQHQITIPKKIWDRLGLQTGTRFDIVLMNDKRIVVVPHERHDALDLSEAEWRNLVKLAHSKKNVSRQFRNTKEAISYLKKL